MDRKTELENRIAAYQDAYYNGEAEITDAEFDALWDELKRLAPGSHVITRIGADGADGFSKEKHIIPMGSQEKAASPAEFRAWAAKLNLPSYIAQYKLDGASLELQYRNGLLVRALTRGDGSVGDDISANARKMKGVVSNLKTDWTGGIRGEVLMFHEIWRTKYADKANCRNAASGLMRKKDGQGCEDLTFIAYDASASGDDGCFKTETDKIEWLRDTGFSASETVILNYVEDVIRYRNEVAEKRAGLPFDIDGLVIKDNKTDAADLRRVRPERQIAFKFDLERATSTLRRVEWSESGGTYTPIGIIDPVRLGGTTVKRANLCNPAMIQDMGLYIGSTVVVVKRGEIIPKIESAEPPFGCGSLRQIVIPTECGCGAKLVNEGTRLYCPNPACDKKLLHRIKKWADVLDIREAGEKTLLQLFNGGRIRRISDLYTLEIRELAAFDRMGEISAAKLVNNIRSPRNIPLSDFIAGFDIEGVGAQIMEVITGAGYDSLEKLRSATVEKLAAIPRIGEITARALIGGLNGTADEMEAVLKTGFVTIADSGRLPLAGQSFCFTGELKTMKRNEAGAKVKSLGGLVKSSVGQGLTYLVTNEPGSGSAKNKSARKSGVKVINEDEFLNVIRKSGSMIPFCA